MPPSSLHPVLHHLQRFLAGRKVRGNVLVAVSGGPDSVCLLHALVLSYDKSLLHVGHFNHHLRGEASEADAVYVRELCEQLGVRVHLGETTQLQPGQKGMEAQARKLRYQWLSEVAEREQCMRVMTGHTMNDQAETVLHHLIRGTGWRGLRGIAPSRVLPSPSWGEGQGVRGSTIVLNPIEQTGLTRSANPSPLTPLPTRERGIRLLRPLLACTREQILDYLTANHLNPRYDASNEDVRFTRNRIRHQVMPQLVEMNSDAVAHLASWATAARSHYDQVKLGVRTFYLNTIEHVAQDHVAIKRNAMVFINDEMLQEMLRRAWRKLHWPVDQMNAARWQEAIEVCRGVRTAVELPGRIMVRRKELVVQFIKQ